MTTETEFLFVKIWLSGRIKLKDQIGSMEENNTHALETTQDTRAEER